MKTNTRSYVIIIIHKNKTITKHTMSKDEASLDREVNVTHEDQKMINQFSKLNSRLMELQGHLADYKKEKETLQDAENDLIMLDDDDAVPYKMGEAFICITPVCICVCLWLCWYGCVWPFMYVCSMYVSTIRLFSESNSSLVNEMSKTLSLVQERKVNVARRKECSGKKSSSCSTQQYKTILKRNIQICYI